MQPATENLPDNQTIAAIDLGSNSFHLSVVRVVDGTLQPLLKDKRLVRLAEGLDADRYLSEEAMKRGFDVLKSFAETVQELRSSAIRVVGTYTLRKARNRNEFLRLARNCMPVAIEVISGDEEARLIYQGVAHTTHLDGSRLILDIGGGSTEFAIGEGFEVHQLSSQPLGCITYTQHYFPDGKITGEAFRRAELAAERRLEIIDRRFLSAGWDSVIGCSGTIKAAAQFWNAHYEDCNGVIDARMLKMMRKMLIGYREFEHIKGVDEHRRALFPAGLAILQAIFRRLEVEHLVISEAALREGVLYELTDRMRHTDIRERTVASLALRYDIDGTQVERVMDTVGVLKSGAREQLVGDEWDTATPILDWAIKLHEIGLHINRRAIQRHSAYIIDNTELPGFSREEQQILALLLMHYRKNFDASTFPDFTLFSNEIIVLMVAMLRLSIMLNIRRLDDAIPEFECELEHNRISLRFSHGWLSENPLISADLEVEQNILANNGIQLTFT